jgi:hypothetical protein
MRQQKRFAKTVWCIKEVMRLTNQTVDIVGMVMERGDEKKIERWLTVGYPNNEHKTITLLVRRRWKRMKKIIAVILALWAFAAFSFTVGCKKAEEATAPATTEEQATEEQATEEQQGAQQETQEKPAPEQPAAEKE